MNKKILSFILAIGIMSPVYAGSYIDKQMKEVKKNTKYQTIQKQTKKYEMPVNEIKTNSTEIKDPKLIKLVDTPSVDEKEYKAKVAKDEEIYKNKVYNMMNKKDLATLNVQPYAVDFYKVYRIAEKIIRANNLDYINWRISIRKSDDWNAYATGVNSINIYTGLYDSLYTNDDAMAYIIGHEISHILLGHQARMQRLAYRYQKMMRSYRVNPYSVAGSVAANAAVVQKQRMLSQSRDMEYMADALGAELMTRAGFDIQNGMKALNMMETMEYAGTPLYELACDHPLPQKRVESVQENVATFPKEWVEEGKYNIMNSEVLEVKKSSDRVSIVISQNSNSNKTFYEPENIKRRLERVAYTNYRAGKMEAAIKYFEKLTDVEDSYVPYLYIAYANEYLYRQTKEDKYLKQSKKALEKAQNYGKNEYITEEIDVINSL